MDIKSVSVPRNLKSDRLLMKSQSQNKTAPICDENFIQDWMKAALNCPNGSDKFQQVKSTDVGMSRQKIPSVPA